MKYKRYFYGGCLLVSLIFCQIALAEPLVINLYDSNGQGLGVDSVQINNILIDALVKNPFDPAVYEWKPLPFNFTFKACQSNPDDPNTLYLEPILNDEEPPCHMSSLNFMESQLVGQSHDWVQINNVRDTIQTQDNTTYYNITLELNLDKLRLEQREKHPIISNPPLADDSSPIVAPKNIIPKQIRIILSWEGNRRLDYDAHLTGPALGLPGSYYNEPDRFHIYFGNKDNEVAALYTDDFSHTQPEIIELFPPPGQETLRPGIYQYSVHHFQGTGNFVDAKVQVRLQIDQEPEQLFEPPLPPPENERHGNSTMQEWKVFQLIVDESGILQIQPLQNLTPSIPPAEVRRGKP